MKGITIDNFEANKSKEWLINELYDMIYEDSVRNTMINICNIRNELHNSKYPNSYEKCCKVLGYEPDKQTVTEYDYELIKPKKKWYQFWKK